VKPLISLRTPASIPIHQILPVEREHHVWEARASQLENFRDYFLFLLAVVPIVVIGFWEQWVWYLLAVPGIAIAGRAWETFRKRYRLTSWKLSVRRGSRAVKELNLIDITDTKVKWPQAQRAFGRGTVRVFTTDPARAALSLVAVRDPEDVQRMIYQQAFIRVARHEDSSIIMPAGEEKEQPTPE
jgi:hypothetical protein